MRWNGYDKAREGAIVVEHEDRAVLRARGRDPVRMLQGLITNDLGKLSGDRAVYGAVLTPKGRMIADMHVVRSGDDLLLLTSRGAVDGLLAHFRKFVPPLFARFEDESEQWRVVGVHGPRVADVLEAVGAAGGSEPGEFRWTAGGIGVLATADAGVPGAYLLAPVESAGELVERVVAAGAVEADPGVFDVLRIEAGTPVWGAELTEERIPLEAGLRQRAISETKGCYTGQEVIIRILHRGHVNWVLRGLRLGAGEVPAAGTPLVREDGKEVARVTSAAESPRLGEVVALGYVRREVEPGATLRLADGGREAVVVAVG